jgi:hypothetical protein
MIQKLDIHEAFTLICKASRKWGVLISFGWVEDFNKVIRAAPYLDCEKDVQILSDGEGIILCDTKEEMDSIYNQTVGDDGPTTLNKYKGKANVYALTCSPKGELMNENT